MVTSIKTLCSCPFDHSPGLRDPYGAGHAGVGRVARVDRKLLVRQYDPPAVQSSDIDSKLQCGNPLRFDAMYWRSCCLHPSAVSDIGNPAE